MLTIHSSKISEDAAIANNIHCALVDSATLMAAEMQQKPRYSGCPLPAIHAVAIQPAEDMVIPIFMCTVHFNGFKLGLREGVGIDQELLAN